MPRLSKQHQPLIKPTPRQRGSTLQKRREQVFERDGWRCVQCGTFGTTKTLKADHIEPLHLGGPDTNENMQTLCKDCHDMKTGSDA